jgi:coenzyme F420-reducing hydrogenase gamma subunit
VDRCFGKRGTKMKKIKVGVFSFTCDEGCSINLFEILNKKFFEWKDKIDFTCFRLLQSRKEIKGMDIAIIEGVISTSDELKKIKEIRKNSKKVLLIGSCAICGSPSNLRNSFDKEQMKEIEPVLKKFNHIKKVLPIKDVIKIDDCVNGCPMNDDEFIKTFEKYLRGGKKCIKI